MKQLHQIALIYFLGALTAGFLVSLVVSTPVVQKSHSTGKCVKVLPAGSCDTLPGKYILEWVH